MEPTQQIWQQVLPLIEEELSSATFNSFIATLIPVSAQNQTLILETQSEFNRNQLKNTRYFQILLDSVQQVTGQAYDIEFILPSEHSAANATPDPDIPMITLNPRYTFETFVIGSSNRFAHAAAAAVADNPGKSYNPLFIYGGVGLGKTHLMHSIGNQILMNHPHAHIMYVTSEKFTNELIGAIRNDRNEEFRARYRNVDVLMVDDIQFISNKEGTQEEFFHTFNSLYDAQKQIVISSDKPPKEIPTLEERLRSRFEWGLIADIQPPNHETRVAILQKKAIIDHLIVSQEVLHYIANRVESNIRELEGSLTRVIAYSSLTGTPPDLKAAAEALKDFYPSETKHEINVHLIQEIVADYYRLDIEALTSKKRSRDIAFPRQIAMYLTRELTPLSLPKIGEAFGGRDHTTVMHAYEKITHDIQENDQVRPAVDDLIKRIRE